MIYTLSENELIGNAGQWPEPPPEGIVVPDDVFQTLRRFALETDQADTLLTFTMQKGRELVRVRQYVGLLPLPGGNYLEILPKLKQATDARSLLLTMLRYIRHSPFRTLTTALTATTQLPLWEVFIRTFLHNMESLVSQGIQHDYVAVEENERFWKGKFQATRQQRENACHAERLAVRYEARTADVPPNRVLKTTLLYLNQHTEDSHNQRWIQHFLAVFDTVSLSTSILDDLNAIRRMNRQFLRYEPALCWAEALLSGHGYGVRAGQQPSLSLLFPMERVFEEYVSHGIRTHWPDAGAVTIQESSAHLVNEHEGAPKFKLRPDILIRHDGQILVLDTKWKIINGNDSRKTAGSYGIEQADLYQLYAYGKKYGANDLFLIYPAHETFQQPLPVFEYDADTRLHVVPFAVTNRLADEVEKLARYALSFQNSSSTTR